MRPTFQYAFVFDGFNRESVKEVLINQKLTTPETGLRLYAPISEYAKRYTDFNKDYFRRWGIGLIIEKTKKIFGLYGFASISNWKKIDDYYIYDIPGNLSIDLSMAPDNTIIALTPTLAELKDLVYKDPEEKFPHWYWRGIACDWLYTPKPEALYNSMNLLEYIKNDKPVIQKVVRPKTEDDISEYLSHKTVKGKHFSWRNKISYTES